MDKKKLKTRGALRYHLEATHGIVGSEVIALTHAIILSPEYNAKLNN